MSKSSWTILEIAGKYAKVRCTCGYTAKRNTYDIKSGKSVCCRSCSYTNRKGVPINVTHGLADSPTMNSYADMKRRCYDQTRKDYKNYGGREITVQKDWLEGTAELSGFSCFVRDLGMRPNTDYQLDRKDNNGNYTKDNCHWVTRSNNMRNRQDTVKVNYKGKEHILIELCEQKDISYSKVYQRIHKYGWAADKAIDT